jgi:hypothetical protein
MLQTLDMVTVWHSRSVNAAHGAPTSGKKDPVRTQASVGTVACVEPPWTAWEGWKRARSKQPACAHYPRRVSPASENVQMSTFQERAYGRRMASQEWQKSKPTCNEHS